MPPVLKKEYKKIIDRLGVQSKDDIMMLRALATDIYMEEQEKLKKETFNRIMSGSLTLDNPEEVPLFRQANGSVMIPSGKLMNVLAFIMYINEVIEWKYPGAKLSPEETSFGIYRTIQGNYDMLPGLSCLVVVHAENYFRFITDMDSNEMFVMLVSLIADFAKRYAKEKAPGMNINDAYKKVIFPMLYDGIENEVKEISDENIMIIDSDNASIINKYKDQLKYMPRGMLTEIINKTFENIDEEMESSELSEVPHEILSMCFFNDSTTLHGEIINPSTIRKAIAAALKKERSEYPPSLPDAEYYELTGNVLQEGVLSIFKYAAGS